MTLCGQLSERMPQVAAGRREWTADEAAHLAGCTECRAEWELVTLAQGLGENVVADLDAHHVTERVLGRLRVEAVNRRRRLAWVLSGLAAAAVVILAVSTGPRLGLRRHPASTAGAVAVSLPELDSLQSGELEALLETMDQLAPTTGGAPEAQGLGDLDTTELERVLSSLEG